MLTGWPSMAASASMPPTPAEHAESVDHRGVGICAHAGVRVGLAVADHHDPARCSMFTWWTMPVPGGTTRNSLNALCPHRRNW